jgi:hypothetical protein
MLPSFLRPLLVGSLALLGTACAPSFYLNVKPAQETGLFAEGKPQAQATADSVEVRLHFEAYEPTRLVFSAEYRNLSRRPVVIDPVQFRYEAGQQPLPAATSGAKAPKLKPGAVVPAAQAAQAMNLPVPQLPAAPIAAIDPEPEITALQDLATKSADKASRVDWLGVALVVSSVAMDVSSIGKRETATQFQNRVALQEGIMAYQIISTGNKVRHAITAEVSQAQAQRLKEYALRKVTLAPGEQVRGYLYFPRCDGADELHLKVPVAGKEVPLKFLQSRTCQ